MPFDYSEMIESVRYIRIEDSTILAAHLDIDGANEALGTYDLSEENYANVVGRQLLLNLLKRR